MTGVISFGDTGSGTGVVSWGLNVSEEGQREYTIVFRIRTNRADLKDGPATIANTAGIPMIGTPWQPSRWSLGGELDLNARCTPHLRVTQYKPKNYLTEFWDVECKFTTRPRLRCQDIRIEDPLAEPQKVSGSFVGRMIEAKLDKDGHAIKSSSHEPIHGPSVEFSVNYPTVTIQQNVGMLQLPIVAQLSRKTVNGVPLWGLEPRTVRLANASWARQYVGSCEPYYTRTFEFEIDFATFDRDDVVDEGLKALGHWDPDPDNGEWVVPDGDAKEKSRDFNRYRDKTGELAHVMLNGAGIPLEEEADHAVIPMCQDPDDNPDFGKGGVKFYHDQVDFGAGPVDVDYVLMLGVPWSL